MTKDALNSISMRAELLADINPYMTLFDYDPYVNVTKKQAYKASMGLRDHMEPHELVDAADIWCYALDMAGYEPLGPTAEGIEYGTRYDVDAILDTWCIGMPMRYIKEHGQRRGPRAGRMMTRAEEVNLITKALEGGADIMLTSYFSAGIPLEHIIPSDYCTLADMELFDAEALDSEPVDHARKVAYMLAWTITGEHSIDLVHRIQSAITNIYCTTTQGQRYLFPQRAMQAALEAIYWPQAAEAYGPLFRAQ